MSQYDRHCHGSTDCLKDLSGRLITGPLRRLCQRPRSYLAWWLENMGLMGTLKTALSSPQRLLPVATRPRAPRAAGRPSVALNLQPGEVVQVKSIDQILSTLDQDRRHNGLLWMNGMRAYCGTRQRVYKRVERIMLEATGQLRATRNTVLLEGLMCDGKDFGGCDRSCLFFWKEAWLERIG